MGCGGIRFWGALLGGALLGLWGGGMPARAAGREVLRVFLLAGQSNMAGADSVVPDPPGFHATPPDRATRFTMAPLPDGERSPLYMAWGELRGQQAKQKLVHGPEVGFARVLHGAGWRGVAMIKVHANFGREVSTWPWGEGGGCFKLGRNLSTPAWRS